MLQRQHAQSPDLKIVLTSGWDVQRIITMLDRVCLEYTFVWKPFTAQQFLLAVQNSFSSHV